jgi:geranylgeranyl pyrophosphate synthase
MGASLALGALAGGAPSATVRRLDEAGVMLGLAFQITDDLLNAGSSLRSLGKRAGTDAARGKATYPRAVGEPRARAEADRIVRAVEGAIERTCPRPRLLRQLIDATARRDR